MAIERINPSDARQALADGGVLVCAYDSPQQYEEFHLDGSIPLQEFESQADSMPKDRQIIFYCA